MAANPLRFIYEATTATSSTALVTASKELVAPISRAVTQRYRSYTGLPGYEHQELPLEYAASYFAREISRETQIYLFNHFIIDYLLRELQRNAQPHINLPRLANVNHNEQDNSITYHFTLSLPPILAVKEWRHFIFKQPNRKNYKDIDNQVVHFVREASDHKKQHDQTLVEEHDWVLFSALLVDPITHQPLTTQAPRYWMRISGDSIKSALQNSFMHQHINDTFVVPSIPLSRSTQSFIEDPCHYQITILAITKGVTLNIDFFKHNFKLKTRADLHKKLIEIFSFRNDMSQRHAIIEELFHLLFTKHRFEIPKHAITRRKEILLSSISRQSDYQIYKNVKNFDHHITLLAEKMLKEELIIDSIAYHDGITVTQTDIASYLHLFNNERLKEFVYFRPLTENLDDGTVPLNEGLLLQAVLREKTLNYIIHTLS